MKPTRSRSAIPIPDAPYTGRLPYDAKDPAAVFEPVEAVRPPEGAPNVVLVLLDDVGFGAASVMGGPCATPTAERLAGGGLLYNRFHTTALCAPTRAALLTGRNHHRVGMGAVTEVATAAPGYTSVRPNTAATLAQILRLNGYATAQFGKCHEVPQWHTSPAGPFDLWPTGSGFDYFYGFLGGEANQYYPSLYEGTTAIEPPRTPEQGYHLTEDLADHATAWIRQQSSLVPDKRFFVYFAPGATHAPHHVPSSWAERYAGRFDAGWDALREQILERQKNLGIVPPETELTARHAEIPAWADLPDQLKPVLARQMEIYAGFLEHTDAQVGRLVDVLEELDLLDETLFLYVVGDNGASGEGTLNGSFNENIVFNGANALETAESMAAHIDEFGGPHAYNHYAVGWAHAMDTPYQWTKQVASHFGGTRNGLLVHWPERIAARGEIRQQFHHVVDIATTVLDVAGIPQPDSVNGVSQTPMDGVSMAYSFDDADAGERRATQYFEVFCNRGIYHEGWTAVTRHSTPWVSGPMPSFDDDVWELYDTTTDPSQAHDLSAEMSEKLHELQRLWLVEAVRNQVLPLDDRRIERFDAAVAGRPVLVSGERQRVYGGMGRLTENSVLNVKNRSHAVTAEIEAHDGRMDGVIVAQGGAFGGWVLYLVDGVLTYCHNFIGLQRWTVRADRPVGAETRQVRMEFAYDGGGLGKGGTVTLFADGVEIGSGRVEATVPLIFSSDETLDIGRDSASAVGDEYEPPGEFTGRVAWVELDVGDLEPAHVVPAEEQFRIAMARQ